MTNVEVGISAIEFDGAVLSFGCEALEQNLHRRWRRQGCDQCNSQWWSDHANHSRGNWFAAEL